MLSDDACSQLIHALGTVRIDYCNSLLYGLPEYSLDRLQKILNTAARILRRVPKFDHITETLMDLHWTSSSSTCYIQNPQSYVSGLSWNCSSVFM